MWQGEASNLTPKASVSLPASYCFQSSTSWGQPCPRCQRDLLRDSRANCGAGIPSTSQEVSPISPNIFLSSSGIQLSISIPPHHQQQHTLQGYRVSSGKGDLGTEFSWEWREQSGGKSMGCPEDQGPVFFPAGPRGFSGGALRRCTESRCHFS